SSEARMREELANLTESLQSVRTLPHREHPPHLQNTSKFVSNQDDDREPIDNELKKQLNNAIAKSDWPKFSGGDDHDLVGFCQWMDMARGRRAGDEQMIHL
ncbi:hypothetical protein PSTG_19922, partial [Puccinia striiformis f. sp. tritici PST-78]